MYNARMYESRKVLTSLGFLTVLIFALYGLSSLFSSQPAMQETSTGASAHLPSPEVLAQLEHSKGFQAFVSYTDRGFEPSEVTIQQGETIRWTNNSSKDLWIASDGGALYPREANDCGSSGFDSCKALKPGDFWEFTFDTKGSWVYLNNLQKETTGVVHVK